ncbi:MAG: hypothetical protein WC509_03055 [Candidatus Izemoplasmatales bacterium]
MPDAFPEVADRAVLVLSEIAADEHVVDRLDHREEAVGDHIAVDVEVDDRERRVGGDEAGGAVELVGRDFGDDRGVVGADVLEVELFEVEQAALLEGLVLRRILGVVEGVVELELERDLLVAGDVTVVVEVDGQAAREDVSAGAEADFELLDHVAVAVLIEDVDLLDRVVAIRAELVVVVLHVVDQLVEVLA